MKLTTEVVLKARNFYNPLKERELDLRNMRISAIENLGVTKVIKIIFNLGSIRCY